MWRDRARGGRVVMFRPLIAETKTRKTTDKPVANFYFTSDDDDAMCLERWQKVIGGYLCALWQKTSATTVYSILRSVFAVTTFRR